MLRMAMLMILLDLSLKEVNGISKRCTHQNGIDILMQVLLVPSQ